MGILICGSFSLVLDSCAQMTNPHPYCPNPATRARLLLSFFFFFFFLSAFIFALFQVENTRYKPESSCDEIVDCSVGASQTTIFLRSITATPASNFAISVYAHPPHVPQLLPTMSPSLCAPS